MNNKKKILIVGAGPGGLSAGMLLLSKGYDVEIFEKERVVGGRNAEIKQDGFTFDVGPTILTVKFILDEIFAEAGEKTKDYLHFDLMKPLYRLYYDDFSFDVTNDPEKMKETIKLRFPGEENGYDLFMKKEAIRFERLYPCLQKPYANFFDLLRPMTLRALPSLHVTKNFFDYLGKYFKDQKLRLAFTFQAKYIGMSPFKCPSLFAILPYMEHKYGIYHVRGGLSKISIAMAEIIKKKGGTLTLNTGISKIIVENGVAKGVKLQNGEERYGDTVVLNADFAHAANNLFEPGILKKYSKEKINKKAFSCSTYMMYLGIKGELLELSHHNVVIAKNYKENMENVYDKKIISDDFSMYVRNASLTDATLAPNGMTNMYILVPMPNNSSGIDWNIEKTHVRKLILDALEKRLGLKDIRDRIVTEKIITPRDWENSGIHLGAVFNLDHSLDQMLLFRPHNKFEEVDNLYIVGGGTHPGSGLPTIYESARIATDLILKNLKAR